LMYHQQYGHFPPAYSVDSKGKRLQSWRAFVMPFMESAWFPIPRPDLPWDSPSNSSFANTHIRPYHCPADDSQPQNTSYVAVVGPRTAWPGAHGSKLSDFKDPSKTVMVIELDNSGINWTEPRDLDIDQILSGANPTLTHGFASQHAEGINVLFADGNVESIPSNIAPEKLARLCE
jgi:prepilin-type processing-associated H-X9-DG protein